MKNLYKIISGTGVTLCYQVASSEAEAVELARMYGHTSAKKARFARVAT